MKIYTIGYGGRKPSDLVNLLRGAGVRTVVDVRLRPDRAAMTLFKNFGVADKGIQKVLASGGIEYRSLVELGNVFYERENWRALYAELLAKSGDLLLARLVEMPASYCLMCAERCVRDCHRLQIAQALAARGFEVEHLDAEPRG